MPACTSLRGSNAVRDENTNNTSFGFSVSATYTVPTFQASATTNLNLTNSRTSARESTHKHMRQQSEKRIRKYQLYVEENYWHDKSRRNEPWQHVS